MNLKIHFGTQRTGSSYLQSTLYHAREELRRQHVLFPKGHGPDERNMRDRLISAGNGRRLAKAVSRQSWPVVRRVANWYFFEARKQKCQTVVISCEQLLPGLSKAANTAEFAACFKAAGFKSIEFMVFLRDPVEQSVSLYRHRAKNGDAPSAEEWFATHNQTALHLNGLMAASQAQNIKVTLLGYVSHPADLMKRFFDAWLDVTISVPPQDRPVNSSLRIPELHLIASCHSLNRLSPYTLQIRFSELNPRDRTEDGRWLDYLAYLARLSVHRHHRVWQELALMLPEGQRFVVETEEPSVVERPSDVRCSDAQLRTALAVMKAGQSVRGRCYYLWVTWIKPPLSRMKWSLIRVLRFLRETAAIRVWG